MAISNIIFPLRGDDVLLGMKKRGFGAGKWNGFGGKPHDGETKRQAAARELKEESCLVAVPDDFEQVARMVFYEADVIVFESDVFFLRSWRGTEQETEEMRPQWFHWDALPYEAMWPADGRWVPLILAGKQIEGIVRFRPGMREVDDFSWHPAVFS